MEGVILEHVDRSTAKLAEERVRRPEVAGRAVRRSCGPGG